MPLTVAITLDIDWAPDFILEDVASLLIQKQVKATWFATHDTPVLAFLRHHSELFEIGIHPNFNPGSSHGHTMAKVVEHCLHIVPEAISARSHGLVQSDYLWRYYAESSPILNECSTYLGHAPYVSGARFYWKGRGINRLPYNYQDNIEMDQPQPIWDAETFLKNKKGIQILDFHPFYLYTNAVSMNIFETVKNAGRPFHEITEQELLPYRRTGEGARTMFASLIDFVATCGGGFRIQDLVAMNAIEKDAI